MIERPDVSLPGPQHFGGIAFGLWVIWALCGVLPIEHPWMVGTLMFALGPQAVVAVSGAHRQFTAARWSRIEANLRLDAHEFVVEVVE